VRQKLVSKLPITGELLLGTLLRPPHTSFAAPFIEPHRHIAAGVALKNVALAVAVEILVPTIDHTVNTFPRHALGACASLMKRSPHYHLLATLPPKRRPRRQIGALMIRLNAQIMSIIRLFLGARQQMQRKI
jgi:hypothetical protein